MPETLDFIPSRVRYYVRKETKMTNQATEWAAFNKAYLAGKATAAMARRMMDAGNKAAALRILAPTSAQIRESRNRQAAIAATDPKLIAENCIFPAPLKRGR